MPRTYTRWTTASRTALWDAYCTRGDGDEGIAAELGTTPDAVRSERNRLSLKRGDPLPASLASIPLPDPAPRKASVPTKWTSARLDMLSELHEAGVDFEGIAAEMGITTDAVATQAARSGLTARPVQSLYQDRKRPAADVSRAGMVRCLGTQYGDPEHQFKSPDRVRVRICWRCRLNLRDYGM